MVWGILLALPLMTVAALAPTFSVRDIVDLVRRWTEGQAYQTEQVTTSLGLMRQQETTVFDAVRVGGLPRRHLVGSGSELLGRVVMVVRTDDLLGDLPETLPDVSPPRYYWRSITYDRYDGRGWYTGPAQMFKYEAGQEAFALTGWPAHRVVRQEIEVVGDLGGLLYVAGSLVTADQDFEVAWRASEDVFAASIGASTYRADSVVPIVTEEQLRSAGTDHGGFEHSGRYRHLPDWVPDRVLALARDLTATEPTPYDRALAIEAHLRTIPYTLDVPLPPPDRDVVDYFLFDLQRGYCDYYATAMVVLARAAGLPARLVVGYFGGTYDAENSRYIVTEADAHAWAEVHLPRYGWVEFEPTGGRPSIERWARSPPVEWPEPEGRLRPATPEPGILHQIWPQGVLGGLALLALAGFVWSVADSLRLCLSTPAAVATTLYRRLRRHGQRLAVPMGEGDTPYEFGASFARHVTGLARGRYWNIALTPAAQEVDRLVELHVQASYAPCPPTADERGQAMQTWWRLRLRLWAAWARQSMM
jgi:transglutaminase-like putative cysteine protease